MDTLNLPHDVNIGNIPNHLNAVCTIGGFIAAGGVIIYLATKHTHAKSKTDRSNKRNSLLSNTKLTDRINNKNMNNR